MPLEATKVAAVLSENAKALRFLNAKVASQGEELALYRRKEAAEKIAKEMEDKGLNEGTTFDEKVADLMGRDDLDTVKAAVDMSAPQVHQVKLSGDEHASSGGRTPSSAAERDFVAACLNQES